MKNMPAQAVYWELMDYLVCGSGGVCVCVCVGLSVCLSQGVFWQLAGSLYVFKPARQLSGAARSREHCMG